MKKEAVKDLQGRENTRKMKKKRFKQKNNAIDNADCSATNTMGKRESDPVVHVPVAQYVTEETDLLQLLRDNFPVISTKGAESVNCDSINKCGELRESSISASSQGQNISGNGTYNRKDNTVVSESERTEDLNPSAECVLASSSRTNDIVSTDEPTTLNQDRPLSENHMDLSTETANTSVDSPTDDDDTESSSESLMLTGLHTCGNLAPNIFRIFLANPHARVLCNVGCCYQLMTEEFWTEVGYTKGKQA